MLKSAETLSLVFTADRLVDNMVTKISNSLCRRHYFVCYFLVPKRYTWKNGEYSDRWTEYLNIKQKTNKKQRESAVRKQRNNDLVEETVSSLYLSLCYWTENYLKRPAIFDPRIVWWLSSVWAKTTEQSRRTKDLKRVFTVRSSVCCIRFIKLEKCGLEKLSHSTFINWSVFGQIF